MDDAHQFDWAGKPQKSPEAEINAEIVYLIKTRVFKQKVPTVHKNKMNKNSSKHFSPWQSSVLLAQVFQIYLNNQSRNSTRF